MNSLQQRNETPRKYQERLAKEALLKNVIVALPTGTGKTRISVEVAKHYLRNKPEKYIIFCAPTNVLRKQQKNYFGKFFADQLIKEVKQEYNNENSQSRILFMTPQTLRNNLINSKIYIIRTSLLIIDEAHNATKDHPINIVMRTYYFDLKKQLHGKHLPRILGLTASPYSLAIKELGLDDTGHIIKLEKAKKNLDCVEVLSCEEKEILEYSSFPELELVPFSNTPDHLENYIISKIVNRLDHDINKINRTTLVSREKVKFLRRFKEDLIYYSTKIGLYGLKRYLEEGKKVMKSNTEIRKDIKVVIQNYSILFLQFLTDELNKKPKANLYSNKIKKLIETLKSQNLNPNIDRNELCCIVFCERRIESTLLKSILIEKRETEGKLKEYRINAIYGKGTKEINFFDNMTHARQVRIVKDFGAKKKFNLLISTSVLEEGIDIQSCNVIVRFDNIMHLRSFIQSRGRARKGKAVYICLNDENDQKNGNNFKKMLSLQNSEQRMNEIIRKEYSSKKMTDFEKLVQMQREEQERENQKIREQEQENFQTNSKTVDISFAVAKLNEILLMISNNNSTIQQSQLKPNYETNEMYQGMFRGRVIIQKNIGFKLNIQGNQNHNTYQFYGKEKSNKKKAKGSAALQAIRCLFEKKIINHDLIPFSVVWKQEMIEYLKKKKEVENKDIEIAFFSGSNLSFSDEFSKEEQKYPRNTKRAFLYHYYINGELDNSNGFKVPTKRKLTSFGIICQTKIDADFVPGLRCYNCQEYEIEVKLERIEIVSINIQEMKLIENFNHFFYSDIFWFRKLKNKNQKREDPIMYFTVPLLDSNTYTKIDYSVMHQLIQTNPRNLEPIKQKYFANFQENFQKRCVPGCIVKRAVGNPDNHFYYVSKISDFYPCNQGIFGKGIRMSYQEYFRAKYFDQFLVQPKWNDKMISTKGIKYEIDIFSPSSNQKSKSNTNEVLKEMIFPIFPEKINHSFITGFNKMKIFMIEFENTLKVTKLIQLIETKFQEKIVHSIEDFRMIKEAVLFPICNEKTNYQRLEFLGDSILKFWTCSLLFFGLPYSFDEGVLSSFKSKYVSNLNLMGLLEAKKFQQFVIVHSPKQGPKAFLYPGRYAGKKYQQSSISLKQLADIAESLIGALFLLDEKRRKKENQESQENWENGRKYNHCSVFNENALVNKFLRMIDYNIFDLSCNPQSTDDESNYSIGDLKDYPNPKLFLSKFSQLNQIIMQMYHKKRMYEVENNILHYTFKRKEFLVQSLTHPSLTHFENYQKLEFLGDGIADMIVAKKGYFKLPKEAKEEELHNYKEKFVRNEAFGQFLYRKGIMKYIVYENNTLGTSDDIVARWKQKIKRGNNLPKIFGDIFEALIGAVYLDSYYSLEKCEEVMQEYFRMIESTSYKELRENNQLHQFNSFLQTQRSNPVVEICEYFQKNGATKFKFVKVKGNPQNPIKRVILKLNGNNWIFGEGKNFKLANRDAAQKGLYKIKQSQTGNHSGLIF